MLKAREVAIVLLDLRPLPVGMTWAGRFELEVLGALEALEAHEALFWLRSLLSILDSPIECFFLSHGRYLVAPSI